METHDRELGSRPMDPFTGERPRRRGDWERTLCWRVLTEHAFVREGARGLSVAAGTDPLLYKLADGVTQLVGIDTYSGLWGGAPRDAPANTHKYRPVWMSSDRLPILLRADARRLPFSSSVFDFVYCIGPSINWIGSSNVGQNVLSEMARVVKPEGLVVFSVEFVEDRESERKPKVPGMDIFLSRWRTLRGRDLDPYLYDLETLEHIIESVTDVKVAYTAFPSRSPYSPPPSDPGWAVLRDGLRPPSSREIWRRLVRFSIRSLDRYFPIMVVLRKS
jgi:ubiquinone/menaquinone biosynthesis C-methylase UbiE